jgi:hypothetical protein
LIWYFSTLGTGKSKEKGLGNLASRDHEGQNPEALKGHERKPTFWHTRIQDIGIPEDNESGDLGIENPKEGCGHGEVQSHGLRYGLGGQFLLSSIRHFWHYNDREIEESVTLTLGLAES